jgi:hypothetical protein
MSHDKIKTAARRRMARTGESYATARRRVIAERMAEDRGRADAARLGDPVLSPPSAGRPRPGVTVLPRQDRRW